MALIQDFKAFVLRGNVVDMAVGVIIGGAFGKIVSSMVNDILMPPIGKLVGNVDFKDLFLTLDSGTYHSLDEATKAGAPIVKYGLFLNTCLDFLIVAGVIFFIVQRMMKLVEGRLAKDEAAAAPTTKTCPECAEEVKLQARKCKHCGSAV